MKIKRIIFLLIAALVSFHCSENKPTEVNGNGSLDLIVVGDSSTIPNVTSNICLANAEVLLSSQYGMRIVRTDGNGRVIVNNLPWSRYSISARAPFMNDPNFQFSGSLENIELLPGESFSDTIYSKKLAAGLVINEIYCAGPENGIFFFFDQYLELYNASQETRYLDGMLLMRVSGNNEGKGPGADEGDDGDIDGVTYIFKFPGSYGEQNYPAPPGKFIVCASDAADHTQMVAGSFNLSRADWEFYNQFSAEDIDNPAVPNLINVRSDRTSDFLINLVSDVIVLANGKDSIWADGIDISTVIDGVEYHSSPSVRKTLDSRIDRGMMISAPRYSGKSMQRRSPGYDNNNSGFDFEVISRATPGFQ